MTTTLHFAGHTEPLRGSKVTLTPTRLAYITFESRATPDTPWTHTGSHLIKSETTLDTPGDKIDWRVRFFGGVGELKVEATA